MFPLMKIDENWIEELRRAMIDLATLLESLTSTSLNSCIAFLARDCAMQELKPFSSRSYMLQRV